MVNALCSLACLAVGTPVASTSVEEDGQLLQTRSATSVKETLIKEESTFDRSEPSCELDWLSNLGSEDMYTAVLDECVNGAVTSSQTCEDVVGRLFEQYGSSAAICDKLEEAKRFWDILAAGSGEDNGEDARDTALIQEGSIADDSGQDQGSEEASLESGIVRVNALQKRAQMLSEKASLDETVGCKTCAENPDNPWNDGIPDEPSCLPRKVWLRDHYRLSLKIMDSGLWLSAAGDGRITASQDLGSGEKFEPWVMNHLGDIALKSANDRWLACEKDGRLIADRKKARSWETFEVHCGWCWMCDDQDFIWLMAPHGGYVGVDADGNFRCDVGAHVAHQLRIQWKASAPTIHSHGKHR